MSKFKCYIMCFWARWEKGETWDSCLMFNLEHLLRLWTGTQCIITALLKEHLMLALSLLANRLLAS